MPFESLSCPNCGSASIQEVKPGTFFCNHCDNVFKYVSPSGAGSTGGCELPAGGRNCGVPAIGHCRTCHRAFCRTHQARALGRGWHYLLDSEFDPNHSAVAYQGYIDWCAACRSAEFDQLDDKDKPALDKPFGEFLEDWFLANVSRAGASIGASDEKAVSDLVAMADQAFKQFPYDPVLPWVGEVIQLRDNHAIDASVRDGVNRLIRVKRQDGAHFYLFSSYFSNLRVETFDTSVWASGGPKMLVAMCTKISQGDISIGRPGYQPPLIRYTRVEEVGASRMESVAGSLKSHFPPEPPAAERPVKQKPTKRRWF